MTKRDFLEKVIAEVENAELKDFAKGEIARMDKVNKARKGKPSKEQKANADFRAHAWEEIANLEGAFTAGAIAEKFDISRPKGSALLTALEKEGKLVSELVKDGKNVHKVYTVKK
nr:MAG TPA: PROTEIN/RNA Complex.7A [Caudoviricetes sp.]